MNIDIVHLVKESMEKMGCAEAIAGELDSHAPVCIAFRSIPKMFVEREGDNLTLWSRLDYAGESQLARCAYDLLAYLMPRASDAFACRRPALALIDDVMILHCRVEPDYLVDGQRFSEALEMFYGDLCAVHEILER